MERAISVLEDGGVDDHLTNRGGSHHHISIGISLAERGAVLLLLFQVLIQVAVGSISHDLLPVSSSCAKHRGQFAHLPSRANRFPQSRSHRIGGRVVWLPSVGQTSRLGCSFGGTIAELG